jgi:hypothetical protein
LLIDVADADLNANDLFIIFQCANNFFLEHFFLPAEKLYPVSLYHFLAIHVLEFAKDVVLGAQKFNFDMSAKLLATISCLPETNFVNVSDWIGAQLVDDTLEVEIAHGFTIDLLTQISKLADQGTTVETKSDGLQLL